MKCIYPLTQDWCFTKLVSTYFSLAFLFQENVPLIDTGKRQVISQNSIERKNRDRDT